MSKQPTAHPGFAPITVQHPVHQVTGGYLVAAMYTRTGIEIQCTSILTGQPRVDTLMADHLTQILAHDTFRNRARRALSILRGHKPTPKQE